MIRNIALLLFSRGSINHNYSRLSAIGQQECCRVDRPFGLDLTSLPTGEAAIPTPEMNKRPDVKEGKGFIQWN
ncbi:MAG: hypothetical protein V2I43_21115 [Parvularcula sp.]|nr:hypothetical protein [Parvularcula sp.]